MLFYLSKLFEFCAEATMQQLRYGLPCEQLQRQGVYRSTTCFALFDFTIHLTEVAVVVRS